MQVQPFERRRNRSEDTIEALRLLLGAVARACGLETLLIADVDGLVVVGVGDDAPVAELSAHAPLIRRCVDRSTRDQIVEKACEIAALESARHMAFRPITIDGVELYLIAVGDGSAVQDIALCRAVMGARRILTVH